MNTVSCLVFFGMLLACIAPSKCARGVVLDLQLTSGHKLVIREGEDVCSLIVNNWAKTFNQEYSNITLKTLQTEAMQKLLTLPAILSKIELKENLFIDCTSNSISSSICAKQTYKESWKIDRLKHFSNLLDVLSSSFSEISSVSNFIKRYEESGLKTTSVEAIMLFSSAYTRFPNNSLLVNRFGQSLQFVNQIDLKNSLYEHAVRNGVWPSKIQRPEIDYFTGLSAHPWHNSSNFAFAKVLEENYETFKGELNTLLLSNTTMFGTENENLNSFSGGDWTALVIKSNTGYSFLSSSLPQTTEILQNIDAEFLLVKYSAMKPGTRILPHTGPSNRRLRAHFCITHTGGARMRVGEEWRTWQEGKVLVIDSSYEHEVVHNGPDLRVVLILDIWHPDYSRHS